MNLKDQTLHLIDKCKDQVVGVAQDTTKPVNDFSVLVYAGVTATIKDSVSGLRK